MINATINTIYKLVKNINIIKYIDMSNYIVYSSLKMAGQLKQARIQNQINLIHAAYIACRQPGTQGI